MADLHVVHTEDPPAQTPLLNSKKNHTRQEPQQEEGQNEETHLEQSLEKLEKFLTFLGFNQSSLWSSALSWVAFLLIGVALPVVVLELSDCSDCEEYQIKSFEMEIVASQACLAAVSLLCLSHNRRKYGIRRFLFVDRFNGQMARFRDDYDKQIWVSICFNFYEYVLLYTAFACVKLCFELSTMRIQFAIHAVLASPDQPYL
jgi:hypothetical protein